MSSSQKAASASTSTSSEEKKKGSRSRIKRVKSTREGAFDSNGTPTEHPPSTESNPEKRGEELLNRLAKGKAGSLHHDSSFALHPKNKTSVAVVAQSKLNDSDDDDDDDDFYDDDDDEESYGYDDYTEDDSSLPSSLQSTLNASGVVQVGKLTLQNVSMNSITKSGSQAPSPHPSPQPLRVTISEVVTEKERDDDDDSEYDEEYCSEDATEDHPIGGSSGSGQNVEQMLLEMKIRLEQEEVNERQREEKEFNEKLAEEVRAFERSMKVISKTIRTKRDTKDTDKRRKNLIRFDELLRVEDAQKQKKTARSMNRNQSQPFPAKMREDDRIVKWVSKPSGEKLPKSIIFDWQGIPNPDAIKYHFLREGRLERDAVVELIAKTKAAFAAEPSLLSLKAPITVVGDVHGQFYDLCQIFHIAGDAPENSYLFLGDYVDRGYFSSEVCFYLFALKLRYPKNIFLLRGNHESRAMSEAFDFYIECVRKYDLEIYQLMVDCFDHMPIAATVACPDAPALPGTNPKQFPHAGSYFCVHGGLSPQLNLVEDINSKVNRFEEVPADGLFCDLLWSDPLNFAEIQLTKESQLEDWSYVRFNWNSRGCGCVYGLKAVREFLKRNGLRGMIRAHEVQKEGYIKHLFGYELFGHSKIPGDEVEPLLFTIFSAPNYCGIYGNLGAVVKIRADSSLHFMQFSAVPTSASAIQSTNPFSFSAPIPTPSSPGHSPLASPRSASPVVSRAPIVSVAPGGKYKTAITVQNCTEVQAITVPFVLPRFMNVISYTTPAVAESIMKFVAYVLSIIVGEDEEDHDEIDFSIAYKIRDILNCSTLIKYYRQQYHKNMVASRLLAGAPNQFELAKRQDSATDRKRPLGIQTQSIQTTKRNLQRMESCLF
eukprot:TRINITY_DN4862_c0_g1_i1.p1 TRINITY_DN4862_c0_g1~~TRINITY_DN4862_c0_g1_i1.p1  ORF type:complete len:882 (-),score=316.27 TRINITY_DN4862_c0_g1_i1:154-2799(-)